MWQDHETQELLVIDLDHFQGKVSRNFFYYSAFIFWNIFQVFIDCSANYLLYLSLFLFILCMLWNHSCKLYVWKTMSVWSDLLLLWIMQWDALVNCLTQVKNVLILEICIWYFLYFFWRSLWMVVINAIVMIHMWNVV